jgi:hypothetical protein
MIKSWFTPDQRTTHTYTHHTTHTPHTNTPHTHIHTHTTPHTHTHHTHHTHTHTHTHLTRNYICGHIYQDCAITTHYYTVFYHFNNS